VLEVDLASNPYLSGALALVWAPYMTAIQAVAAYQNNPRSWHVAPHMIAYAGRSDNMALKVPFISPYSHLDLRSPFAGNIMGTFLLVVLNPILYGAAATETSVGLTIYVSFEDTDFAVINPTAVSIIPQGATFSRVAGVANAVNSAVQGVDAAVRGDAYDAKAHDYPNMALNPMPLQTRPYTDVANTTQTSYHLMLDASGNRSVPVDPAVAGTQEDEMSLDALLKRWSYYKTVSVDATVPVGASFLDIDLGPCGELFTAPINSTQRLCLFDYVSLFYSQWRGSIEWKFVAVANAYQIMRVQICSHYFFESAGLTIEEALGQYSTIWTIKGGVSEITIVFPFRSITEWKKVNNGSYPSARDYTCGQASLRLVAPVATSAESASSMQINCYVRGGSDYEVRFVGNNAIDYQPVPLSIPAVMSRGSTNRNHRRGRRRGCLSTRPLDEMKHK
jgi:hypothetical protein